MRKQQSRKEKSLRLFLFLRKGCDDMLTHEEKLSLYSDCEKIILYYGAEDRIKEIEKVLPKLNEKYKNEKYAVDMLEQAAFTAKVRLETTKLMFKDFAEFDSKFKNIKINSGLNFVEMKKFINDHKGYANEEALGEEWFYVLNLRNKIMEAGGKEFS